MKGRVVQVSGLHCLVEFADTQYRCDFRGRVKTGTRGSNAPVIVGDWVDFEPRPPASGVVERRYPRTSKFARGGSATKPYERVVAVNLDRLIVVVAAKSPALRPGFIDRALVMAHKGAIDPVICVNKIDLDPGGEFEAIADIYRKLGYPFLLTSAATGTGVAELRALLDGRVTAFVGHSGVGKSSLLNHIDPGLELKTRGLMAKHDRGRHATTAVQLYRLSSGGGHVADTPGIKELQLHGVEPAEVVDYFVEMAPLVEECHFRDCMHLQEPGCAVLAAMGAGAVSQLRHDGYRRIVAELR